ncbi:MAG: hypothetical protein FWG14_13145 [Peptococcaceae bacterium]|nr:hypothetical protein [Peptococcaceae bacterium]
MSYWEYRIIRKNGEFGIFEAYFRDDGGLEGFSENPVSPRGDTLNELIEDLVDRYSKSIDKPILEWKEK